jgi:CDP-6-deoxy-D-xylo-4-hexulose-3-dehydrase
MNTSTKTDALRSQILGLVAEFAAITQAPKAFVPGITPVPVSGKVLGASEFQHLVEASLDGWLTTGRFNDAFEKKLAAFLGARCVLTTNSGSSANLLALSALTSESLGPRALRAGDEVISVAAGFPTTINPILQNGLVPVFVDVDIPTYNIDPDLVEAAVSDRTRAIMLAHTLGNPFNLDVISAIARKYNLWLVEDCCDALGSTFDGKKVGSFGHIGTLSFYPAHHITTGEGGAVFTNDLRLKRIVESFRDWGRDCYCPTGKENTCGKRFDWELSSLPKGYDHKYIYSHAGYNLKITDMQAALGLAQIERLPQFIAARKANFRFLHQRLESLADFLILPEALPKSDPSWFGFPITIRDSAPINRVDLLKYLDQNKIGTRLLFTGNATRQPYFRNRTYRVAGNLDRSDIVMNNTFWIGVYPGLSDEMLEYVATRLETFCGIGF